MKKGTLIILILAGCLNLFLNSCTKGGKLEGLNGNEYILSGDADGRQMIPSNTTALTKAGFSGWCDDQSQTVTFSLKWNDIWSGSIKDTLTSINLYGPGDLLITTVSINNANNSGNIIISLSGGLSLAKKDIAILLAGKCYYVLNTKKFPSGIARGQINAAKRDPAAIAKNVVINLVWAVANKTQLQIGDTTTLKVAIQPGYATIKELEWKTSNAAVVAVTPSGQITALSKGIAQITITSKDGGGATSTCLVAVGLTLSTLSRTGWTVTCSSERVDDGGGKNMVVDGNFSTYWHSQWGPDMPLPHWLLIDMQQQYDIAAIKVFRRIGSGDTKTIVTSVSADGVTFDNVGSAINVFAADPASTALAGSNSFVPTRARYVLITVTESNRVPYANISEVFVSGYQ